MKLLILITSLFAFNLSAETTVKKTFDGKSAVCLEKADVGSRAYKIKVLSNEVVDGKRNLELQILLFKCAEIESGLELQASSVDEVLHSYILLPDGSVGLTNNKLVSMIVSASDEDGRNLHSASTTQTEAGTTVLLSVNQDLKKIFIRADVKTDITSPIGNLEGAISHFGGFVLAIK